ncbi:hypothetical protein [Mycobacterium gordonae]
MVSRTGGAPTLAFGMAEMLHRLLGGSRSTRQSEAVDVLCCC